ncbi:MAG: hypothetical protein ACJAX5_002717, partial [Patiriisocius sp.]
MTLVCRLIAPTLVGNEPILMNLTNKRILLGVTGGIAAYKAAELTRR